MRPGSLLAILLGATLAGSAYAEVGLAVDPVFEGFNPNFGFVPLIVTVINEGPDTRGVIRVSSSRFTTDYPVELPKGSRKQIVTYGQSDYSGQNIQLITDQGVLFKQYQSMAGYVESPQQAVALISDSPGGIAFLKGRDGIQDVYTTPARAPDRAVGYSGMGTVILGEGTERLRDEQVHALKLYALSGGAVVFVGGASPSALRDPRWQEVLPASNLSSVTRKGSPMIAAMGGTRFGSPITFTTGTPYRGASVVRDGSVPLVVERPFGLGRTVMLAFDPFDKPLESYSSRAKLVAASLKVQKGQAVRNFVQAYVAETPQSVAATGPPTAQTVQEDPFSMTLPPSNEVFSILFLYAVIVVPINFLVLRKLNRGELAWFTAPLIAIGFAGILLASARNLYAANLSTASQGVVVTQEGLDEGIYLGKTQMFLPVAGTYDLKLEGVDSLGLADLTPLNPFASSEGQTDTTGFRPVDVGEIRVPEMRVANLAFREMFYRQRFPLDGWFSIRKRSDEEFEVRNDSQVVLRQARVGKGFLWKDLGDLQPGQSKVVKLAGGGKPGVYGPKDVRNFVGEGDRLALTGVLEGFKVGPRIGKEVANRTAIELVLFGGGN